MRVVVQPQRGTYRLLFTEGGHIRGTAFTALAKTPKGVRPVHYRLKWGPRREYKNTPSRDLIGILRQISVILTRHDAAFELFLADFQVPFTVADLCRVCLIEDRITPVEEASAVAYRGGERICMDCAKKELRRELTHLGRIGRPAMEHLDRMLEVHRDIDMVLATVQPGEVDTSRTLFDRMAAHPVQVTANIETLPLPQPFVAACGVTSLMPAQQIAYEAGLLYGRDLLVVAATASGKTFIGEMAGLKNQIEGRGRFLFLVPLVALAVQKFQRFSERYGSLVDVGLLIGKSRVNLPGSRSVNDNRVTAPLLVATYEGIDHMIRCGRHPGAVGTVVIDEVQMLEDPERGHRLDGLVARLRYLAPGAQFLFLSATIGSPRVLAKKLHANLVEYAERPVPLERHLIFLERRQKIPTIRRLAEEEFVKTSTKGYHGQSIIFTNSRVRCQVIADALGPHFAPYHAGLTAQERRETESKLQDGKITGVVTTAALGAGVDFPASQVVFDSLAMGISWLSVQEFNQMAGRAGRPDFHDLGRVVILAEPGCTYERGSPLTEDEVALRLLKGEMEEVAPEHDVEASTEEFVASAIVCGGRLSEIEKIEAMMVGSSEPALPDLLAGGIVGVQGDRVLLSDLAYVMAAHFIGAGHLSEIRRLIQEVNDPLEILAELDCLDTGDERQIPRAARVQGVPEPKREAGGRKKGKKRSRS
jgi:helicase